MLLGVEEFRLVYVAPAVNRPLVEVSSGDEEATVVSHAAPIQLGAFLTTRADASKNVG